jgi:hypothetical protein
MSEKKESKKLTIEELEVWVDRAKQLVSGYTSEQPTVKFSYCGAARYAEDMPSTLSHIEDVEYSIGKNTLTFFVME